MNFADLLAKVFDCSSSKHSTHAKFFVLGSSGSGKTTLIKYLERGKPIEENVRTTLGIDYRTNPVAIDNWQFSLIDIGGQEIYQKTFWSLSISQADAVIYLFDGTIKLGFKTFQTNLKQFEYMLNIIATEIPLLILINKQDLPDCISAEAFIGATGLDKLIKRSMTFLQTSAKYGDGVENAMLWLIEKLEYLQ